MTELKHGDRVTVEPGDHRKPFNGTITGEGRHGDWWLVLKDGRRVSTGWHKSKCHPERNPTDAGSVT